MRAPYWLGLVALGGVSCTSFNGGVSGDAASGKDATGEVDTPMVPDVPSVMDAGVSPRDDGPTPSDVPDVPGPDVLDADGGAPPADGEAGIPPACASGLTLCGNTCADTSRSAAHCGACNTACPSGTTCALGRCMSARVDAIHPSLVDRSANNRVCLEGVFPEGVTVSFPGVAAPVAPAVAGPRRVCVDVPSGATSGGVRVVAGGTMSPEVSFRRTTFLAGLQTFRSRYEQADYARQTPSLNEARASAASFATDRYVYLIGGRGADGMPMSSVERALINADGSLGRFEALSQSPANARDGAVAVRIGQRVYVIGGDARGTVESATIIGDGTLGPFENAGALEAGTDVTRRGLAAVLVGGSVCLVGGRSGSNAALQLVSCAPITGDGSLGAFATSSRLGTARADAAVAVIGDQLCAFGGSSGTAAIDSVECATVQRDGSIGAFEPRGALGVAREGANVVALGTRVYVIGGRSGTSDSIEYADISPSGTFGAFTPLTNRAPVVARRGAAMFVVGNYVYRVGGLGVTALASIERAQIIATGSTIGAFAPAPMEVRSASYGNYFAVGERVCAITGSGDTFDNGIACATVATDSSLGLFSALTVSNRPQPGRDSSAIAVIDPWLYVFGGETTCGTPAMSCIRGDVYRARLGPQGPVGGFEGPITGARALFGGSRMIVIDDRVYSVGGMNSNRISTRSINRFDIRSGDLSAGTLHGETVTARFSLAAAVLGDHVTALGGQYEGGVLDSVERASITSPGTLGAFTTISTTLVQARAAGSPWQAILGDRLFLFGGYDGTRGTTTIQSAPIEVGGNLGSFRTEPRALPFTSAVTLTLGNYVYAFATLQGATPTAMVIQRAEIQ